MPPRATAGPASVGVLGDCSQVAPHLFVGNAAAAADAELLRALEVTLVANVADDLERAGFARLAALYAGGAPADASPRRCSMPLPDVRCPERCRGTPG